MLQTLYLPYYTEYVKFDGRNTGNSGIAMINLDGKWNYICNKGDIQMVGNLFCKAKGFSGYNGYRVIRLTKLVKAYYFEAYSGI